MINTRLVNKKLKEIDCVLDVLQLGEIVKIFYNANYFLLINLTKKRIYFGKEFRGFDLDTFQLFRRTVNVAMDILKGKYDET